MKAEFLSGREAESWRDAAELMVCAAPGESEVVAQVGVVTPDGHRLRISVQANAGYSCFQDVRCVGELIYIGFGRFVFVVNSSTGEVEAHPLEGYFGHIYTQDDLEGLPKSSPALVASASELLSFSADGRVLWRTPNLGIDGVVVSSVQGDLLKGAGEFDPPGGWQDFSLLIRTGEKNDT